MGYMIEKSLHLAVMVGRLGLLFWVLAPVPSAARDLFVGFAQDTLENDWRLGQARALAEAFAEYPNIRFEYSDGKGQTGRQIQDIENFVRRGVDILIVSPRDGRAMAPAISQVYRQGIPVILLTRSIESPEFTTFIAPDDKEIARQAARHMAERSGGKARILVLQGLPTVSTTKVRTEAFKRTLSSYPGMSIVAIKPGNYLRSDAIRAVEEALREGVIFDAIYAQSDSMAVGARLALRKAGHDPKKFLIAGIDYVSESREAIRNGEQSVSFVYPTCAREAVDIVLKIGAGKAVPKTVTVNTLKVTKENVDEILPVF